MDSALILNGIIASLLSAFFLSLIATINSKIRTAREPDYRYSKHSKYFHWQSTCDDFPELSFENGQGEKEPCIICRMITTLENEKWSMFRLPWYKRFLMKKGP